MRRKASSRKTMLAAWILVVAMVAFVLWANGIFYIVDRQTSPNGNIVTTVYSRNVSDVFPKNDGFTMKSTGDFNGTRIYTDGSAFEDMWWSPDSKYQVVSTVHESNRLLELIRYEKSSIANLNLYINMNLSSHEEFTNLMTDKTHWETLQFDFVSWKEEPGGMTVLFAFEDAMGNPQSGTLDFNCETGVVSNITFQEP